jgi:tripartite-type tricarboxylate transporter receptor subunit TctC
MKILHILLTSLILGGLMRPAAADQYPSRPVTIIVPYAAGGATDIVARLAAKGLWDELGQSFAVENRGGGGGMIGMAAAASAPADGYTLLVASTGPATISPLLYPKLKYDPLVKLDPIIQIASAPGILLVRNGLPAKTIDDLIKLSKQSPGKLNMASAGNGSLQQLMGEYLQLHEGIKWTHVPFRGSAPALNELIAERVDVMVDVVPSAAPFVKSDKMRALAVMSPKRSSQLPDVPTFEELGYKEIDFSGWHALLAPKGTPKDVIDKLNAAVNKLLQKPEFQSRLDAIGAQPNGGTSEQLHKRMADEMQKWEAVIKRAGLVVN